MNQVKVKYQALLMLLFYEKLKEELDIVTEFLWIRALIGFDFDFWSERSYTQNNGGKIPSEDGDLRGIGGILRISLMAILYVQKH